MDLLSGRSLWCHRPAQTVDCFSVFVSVMTFLLGWVTYTRNPAYLDVAAPFMILWFLSPLIGWLLTSRKQTLKVIDEISYDDRNYLRRLTRRTWRFLTTSSIPGRSGSPDNYQVSHQDQVAMRTSPTNIGLWMLSLFGARDCGYVNADALVDRLSETMLTLGKLEKYEGHLLNWYDLSDLHPLEPRYVSSVDSGNLIASIWVVESGLKSCFIVRCSMQQSLPVLLIAAASYFISPTRRGWPVVGCSSLSNDCPNGADPR